MTDVAEQSTGSAAVEDREDRHQELRDIFVAATGAEEFTERQEQRTTSKVVAEEGSVAEFVTDAAKADGLGDAYADPLYEGDGE